MPNLICCWSKVLSWTGHRQSELFNKKVVIRVHLPDVYYSLSGQINKLIKTLFVLTRLVRTGIKVDKMIPVKRILNQLSIIHLDLVLITYCFWDLKSTMFEIESCPRYLRCLTESWSFLFIYITYKTYVRFYT